MRINNNLMAMNTHRQLGINNNKTSKSVEKLSSGYRINRAGDDAAGLSISEKMRGQIRGLNQASRNGQDGISLIQTAEGALNESQAILQRMRELSVQSANDTNVDLDRGAIQNEMDQLGKEINRIADTTEFNTQALLKGDGGVDIAATGLVTDGTLASGAESITTAAKNTDAVITIFADTTTAAYTINGEELKVTFAADAGLTGNESVLDTTTVTGNTATINIDSTTNTVAGDAGALRDAYQAMIDDNDTLKGQYTVSGTGADIVIEAVSGGTFDGAAGSISAMTIAVSTGGISNTGADTNVGSFTAAVKAESDVSFTSVDDDTKVMALVGQGMDINGTAIEFYNSNDGEYTGEAVGVDVSAALYESVAATKDEALTTAIVAQSDKIEGVDLSAAAGVLTITAETGGTAGNAISVTDGATAGKEFNATFQIGSNETQTMEIAIGDMRSSALGIENLDISTSETAQSAISTIDDALTSVSEERATLGAFQNRLEHTIKNLDTSSENLQAAESRIRDVDMAKEMMEFTKNNILSQAAQSMLAQANQAPQGVLQLLR